MASPESSQVQYVRVRPVPRLEDQSVVTILPVTVDPGTTEIIRKVNILFDPETRGGSYGLFVV